MTILRLHPTDPEVRRLTCKAILASNRPGLKRLVVRCSRCRGRLAKAAYTDAGPFFVSRWREPVVLSNGWTQRQQEEFENEVATLVEGSFPTDQHHSVYAILALPPRMTADYPDLMVRCERDGDAVLDRRDVLDRIRRGDNEWDVEVSFPRREYETLDTSWLLDAAGPITEHHRVLHFDPEAM